ncbi:MAG TPA: carboxypeptidase-like regulatory domain-containing protein [Pyrinomonadaceae bacterium]|nr:carboxypeptidase-like regulatory domain-containing protein [Pyrinomonadaceae bacterium]
MIPFRNLHVKIIAAFIVLAALSSVALAQSGRSWMNGFVLDESDTNGISGATVELIGDQDNARLRSVHLTAKTDERGKYSFTQVPYGDYTFRVSADGFTPYEVKIYMLSDSLTELHVKLRKAR